tara:strand:+ start:302 stop:472 length:171 start_codon:yes stop_codon:yes gene_type:complete
MHSGAEPTQPGNGLLLRFELAITTLESALLDNLKYRLTTRVVVLRAEQISISAQIG